MDPKFRQLSRMYHLKHEELRTMILTMIAHGECGLPTDFFDLCKMKSGALKYKHHLHHISINDINYILDTLIAFKRIYINGNGEYQLTYCKNNSDIRLVGT